MPKSALAELPHPSHQINRVAKAIRVADWIVAHPEIFPDLDTETVANWPANVWALVNENMGEKLPMSRGTVSAVVGILAVRGA